MFGWVGQNELAGLQRGTHKMDYDTFSIPAEATQGRQLYSDAVCSVTEYTSQ